MATLALDRPRLADHEPGLHAGRLVALSSLAWPLATAGLPLAVLVPAIYAEHHGLSLTALGAVFLLARVWDAVTDPLVGTLSDRTRTRLGRRKPWILAGVPIFAAGAILLFYPPVSPSAAGLTAILFLFYLGWTMIQIPYAAWTGELSGHYHERTRVQAFLHVSTATALLAALILPTWLDQVRPGDAELKLAVMGALILGSLAVAVPLALRSFPEPALPAAGDAPVRFAEAFRLIAGDRLLLKVLASDFAVSLGQGIRASLIVFYVSFVMGRPEWGAGLYLLQFAFGIVAGPVWLRIGRRLGKARAAVAGEVAQVAINLALLLVTPEGFALLLALTVAQGLTQGSGNLMLRAIVADVADRQRLETGRQVTGLYFSVFSLANKGAMAVAVGIALPLVAALGFDPRGANDASTLQGLALVFALGPAVAHALSALFIHGFPLDQQHHEKIRRALARDAADFTPPKGA
jgi:Na+/melibiose symporter-like transporter